MRGCFFVDLTVARETAREMDNRCSRCGKPVYFGKYLGIILRSDERR